MKRFTLLPALAAAFLAGYWLARKDDPPPAPVLPRPSIAVAPSTEKGGGSRGAGKPGKTAVPPATVEPSKVTVGPWSNYAQGASKESLAIRIANGALNHDYEVTPAVVSLLSLTPSEEIEINKVIKTMIADAETRTASRVEPVPGKEVTFRIKADPAVATETVTAFQKKAVDLLGSERGKNLLDSFDLFRLHGAFGAVDVEITFEDKIYGEPGDETSSMQGNYIMTSPETGAVITSGSAFFEMFARMFGKKTFSPTN